MNGQQRLDQNELLAILLDIYEKGQETAALEAADVISDIASKLKPLLCLQPSIQDETYV